MPPFSLATADDNRSITASEAPPMEIKIECSCGQHYAFEVEPENGRMPVTVGCPNCGLDGTEAANAFIEQALASSAPPLDKPRVRVAGPPPPAIPPPEVAPPTTPGLRQGRKASVARQPGRSERPSAGLGVIGAVAGGLVGMIAWYLLIKVTNYEIGYAAWGVGVLAGLGARLLGRQGSTLLGVTAGVSALVGIIGGEFLAARAVVHEVFAEGTKGFYEAELAYAKEALQAIPNGSDAEIRAFLAKKAVEDGVPGTAADLSPEVVKAFREQRLPELRDLASGKRTRADVDKQMEAVRDSVVGDLMILKQSLSLWTLLWLFLGVGSAYKIASNG